MTLLNINRHKLDSLKAIPLNMETTMSFDEMLTMAVERVSDIMNAQRTTLFLVEPNGSLLSRVLEGDDLREIRLSSGQGLVGWTARTGVPIRVSNVSEDPRFDPSWDELSGFTTRNALCYPIRNKEDRITGVIEVLNSRGDDFEDDDLTLLGVLSIVLSILLENTRFITRLIDKNREISEAKRELENRHREINVLLELERVLSRAENLDALGSRSFDRILDVMDADLGSIYLMTAAGAQKRVYSRDGKIDTLIRVNAGTGFAGVSAARNMEMDITDPRTHPLYEESIQVRIGRDLTNLIVVPLPFEEQENIQGAVMICNKRDDRRFDAKDKMTLRLIAQQLATAVLHIHHREDREREHRLATVGRLLAGVLHDLRTPITTISGYAELLACATEETEKKDYLDHIHLALNRIKSMTAEIVAFSRGEKEILPGPVSLPSFVDRFTYEVQNYLKSNNIDLIVRQRTGGTVKLDEARLLRAFQNITNNAVEAMPTGGSLIFEVDQIEDRLIFSFTDTGHGIPESIQGTIFNSFVSFGKEQGTGLGLAVAREIIMAHGGQITYTTTSGSGTTFLVTLPMTGT